MEGSGLEEEGPESPLNKNFIVKDTCKVSHRCLTTRNWQLQAVYTSHCLTVYVCNRACSVRLLPQVAHDFRSSDRAQLEFAEH